jgi:hypothetical protein
LSSRDLNTVAFACFDYQVLLLCQKSALHLRQSLPARILFQKT